jgi:hypothetical protein
LRIVWLEIRTLTTTTTTLAVSQTLLYRKNLNM